MIDVVVLALVLTAIAIVLAALVESPSLRERARRLALIRRFFRG